MIGEQGVTNKSNSYHIRGQEPCPTEKFMECLSRAVSERMAEVYLNQ